MRVIIFDTETTGIPQAQAPLERQPYVCQFAAVSYNCDLGANKMEEVERLDLLIKPPVSIPFACFEVHGINDEMVADKPSFEEVVDQILEEFGRADVAVAHNISFDQRMLEIELERIGRGKAFLPDQLFDTMDAGRDLCRLPGKRPGQFKSPKLIELHRHLFGEGFEMAHNAIYDVLATGRCVEKLLENGVFQPEEPVQDSLF